MLTALADELVGTLNRFVDLAAGERAGFDPSQPRDPHTGKWIDVPGVGELIDAVRRLAKKLNDGKRLDLNDPDELELAQAIGGWTKGGGPPGTPASLKDDVAYAIRFDPAGDLLGAVFARAVAAAPPDAPVLYRGMHHVEAMDIPREGQTFDLGPTSFTRDRGVADEFSIPRFSGSMPAGQYMVRVRVRKGSRALRIDRHAGGFAHEREHVGMGRYRVVSRREPRDVTVKTDHGKRTLSLIELEIEQVDPSGDPTYERPGNFSDPNDYGVPFGGSDYGMFN